MPLVAETEAPATIIVSLPSDARMTVDGRQTQSIGDTRTLVSPSLNVGETYVYTIRVEYTSNGQTRSETREVTVQGGRTSTVSFDAATQSIASAQ